MRGDNRMQRKTAGPRLKGGQCASVQVVYHSNVHDVLVRKGGGTPQKKDVHTRKGAAVQRQLVGTPRMIGEDTLGRGAHSRKGMSAEDDSQVGDGG